MGTKKIHYRGVFAFFILLMLVVSAFADDPADGLSECATIENDLERFECFGRSSSQPVQKTVVGSESEDCRNKLSVLEKHWDLDTSCRRNSFILRPYRLNYFLPVAYNSSPNDDTNLEYDPQAHAQFNEAKFQLSFKAKVWEDFFNTPQCVLIKGMDIWVAYTQMAFWQLYNSAFSSPFRDTNYEPEILLNFRSQYKIPGLMGAKLQYFNVGLNHQSNGRSRPLSRSWNRIVGNIGLEKGKFNLQIKTWYRIPEKDIDDDNPEIIRCMGYGELWMTYFLAKQRIAVMLRNNLRRENLGAIQVDWSIPPATLSQFLPEKCCLKEYLTDKFSLYVQYFNGYGEGLMDYNKSINRISVGIMIAEWN